MCDHSTVKCLSCGAEGSPASLLGQKKKTMTPAALAARKLNAQKAGRPKKEPKCEP